MNRLILHIFCFFFISSLLFSQKVLISEYFNASSYNQEWTELIIAEDNINIVGYTIRDNSAVDLSQWAGGVKFKDVAIWRNLRKGTIIVINHRNTGSAIDVNSADGYIEIDAENSTYFEKTIYCDGCTLGSWGITALSIRQTCDIVQVRDASDNEVHSLAHMTSPLGLWNNLSGAKISSNSQAVSDGSVRVVPGRNISEYKVGFDNSGSYTGNSTQHSKGRPNTSQNFPLENYKYWHNLRKPEWNSPALSATIKSYGADLSWNIMTDLYPMDNTQGYLILRIPSLETDLSARPTDGKIYYKGDKLGSAIVVDNVFNSTRNTYSDYFTFNCGESFVYQIYAFRYNQDSFGDDNVAFYQKGRIYNSSAQFLTENTFAQSKIIEKPLPSLQLLAIKSGSQINCEGNKTILTFYPSNDTMKIEWFRDNILIPNQSRDTLVTTQSGTYTVKLTSKDNCSKTSNTVLLQFIPNPIAKIGVNSNYINKDTTINLCYGNSLTLNGQGGDSIVFYRNNKFIFTGKSLLITESGTYKVLSYNQKMCSDTSFNMFINFKTINFSLSKNRVDFNLANNEFSKEDSILITNSTSDTLTFENISLTSLFEIVSPNLPLIIFPHSSKNIVVRFKTTVGGLYEDVILLKTQCGKKDSVLLVGLKSDTKLISNLPEITFPDLLKCKQIKTDTTLTISNFGDTQVTIEKPLVNSPFIVLNTNFPVDLKKSQKLNILIEYLPNLEGEFSEFILIPYSSTLDKDTLKVKLSANNINPKISILDSHINFGKVNNCIEFKDTSITILNPNKIDLKIEENISSDFTIKNLPIILKGKEKTTIETSISLNYSGIFNNNLLLKTEPCSIVDSFKVSGEKNGTLFFLSKDTLEFDDIIFNCGDTLQTKSLILSVSDLTQNPKIIKWEIINNLDSSFKTNLPDSLTLTKSNEIKITFSPQKNKDYFAKLNLILEPCGILKTVFLKGSSSVLSYYFNNDTVNFGKLPVVANEKSTIRLNNTGSTDIEISNINGLKSPFGTNISFPIKIDKNDNKLLEFNYLQSVISNDTQKVIIEFSKPCLFKAPIYLIAQTYDKSIDTNIYHINISVGDDSCEVGKTAVIPMSIYTDNKTALNKAEINKFSLVYKYNPTMLYPDAIETMQKNVISDNRFLEISPGRLLVETTVNDNSNLQDGLIYNLNFKTLYGNSNKTEITIDSVEFISNKITRIDSLFSGSFTKTNGESFDFIYLLSARLINYNEKDGNFKFEVFTPVKDEITYKIYNVLGQIVDSDTKNYPSGNSIIVYNSSKLPYGAYFIEFSNSSVRSNFSFTIVK